MSGIRDRSQTLVIVGAWCKKYLSRKFFGAPLQTAKTISGPPFLPWKLRVNPIEKHVNSIFNGKSVVIFFRSPLTRVKHFKGPLFASSPPLQVFVNGPSICRSPVTPSITMLRGYCTSGPYFWRLCAFSQKIKQLRTKYPIDLVRNVLRNSKITVLLQ